MDAALDAASDRAMAGPNDGADPIGLGREGLAGDDQRAAGGGRRRHPFPPRKAGLLGHTSSSLWLAREDRALTRRVHARFFFELKSRYEDIRK
ncbi:hypothetical protein ACRAWD_23235 [Caulobacter segnis]